LLRQLSDETAGTKGKCIFRATSACELSPK
jgi:hypothetical protein